MADAPVELARVDHLSVDVGTPPVRVLSDVTIDLTGARRVVLLGANGSGKSTLLLAMAGILPLAEGRVRLPAPVALLVQDPCAAWLTGTVGEEVGFALRYADVTEAEAAARVAAVLDRLDIASLEDRSPRTLSGGEQQRVQLAAVLAAKPRTLLVDEPTAHLDPETARILLRAIGTGPDAPALVVTATPDAARSLTADVVVCLERGRVRRAGTPGDVWSAASDTDPPAVVHVARAYAAAGRLTPPFPTDWRSLAARVGP